MKSLGIMDILTLLQNGRITRDQADEQIKLRMLPLYENHLEKVKGMSDNSEPAYPCQKEEPIGQFYNNNPSTPKTRLVHHKGMTKREMYAMAAMQGICAGNWPLIESEDGERRIAKTAFVIADAMIEESQK